MTNHAEHENQTHDETVPEPGAPIEAPTLDPRDVDQADVEVSDTGKVAAQPHTGSGFEDEEAATQALHDGPVLDPVDDANPETTGAG